MLQWSRFATRTGSASKTSTVTLQSAYLFDFCTVCLVLVVCIEWIPCSHQVHLRLGDSQQSSPLCGPLLKLPLELQVGVAAEFVKLYRQIVTQQLTLCLQPRSFSGSSGGCTRVD